MGYIFHNLVNKKKPKKPPIIRDYRITIPNALLHRIRPIVAQYKKDSDYIHIHTIDADLHPSATSLITDAIELYCDLHIPIETTPIERLTDAGKLAKEALPSNHDMPYTTRDQWQLRYLELLKKELDKNTELE